MKIKIDGKKIKNFLKKLPQMMVKNGVFTLIFLFFLSVLIGVFLFFYFYPKAGEKSGRKLIKFEEKKYQEIMSFWKEREIKCQQADEKSYPNFFQK